MQGIVERRGARFAYCEDGGVAPLSRVLTDRMRPREEAAGLHERHWAFFYRVIVLEEAAA